MGDRILTDVLMANANGWKSIYVRSIIDGKGEGFGAYLFRSLEQRYADKYFDDY